MRAEASSGQNNNNNNAASAGLFKALCLNSKINIIYGKVQKCLCKKTAIKPLYAQSVDSLDRCLSSSQKRHVCLLLGSKPRQIFVNTVMISTEKLKAFQ